MRSKDSCKVDAIFKATLHLVKERGLAGITMSDISREASLGTGTLYIYFKNKEELIRALFQECRTQSADRYFQGIDGLEGFEPRMHRVFTNIIAYKMTFFEVSAFLEQTYHSPFVCMTDLKKKEKALSPLLELIREGMDQKLLKEASPDLILSYLFGIVNEMVKKSYFSGKKLAPADIEQLYGIFWDGIRYRAEERAVAPSRSKLPGARKKTNPEKTR